MYLADTTFVESTGVWIIKSILIFAFVMAQAPRNGGSLSMMGACKTPLPYGPVVLLQYALPSAQPATWEGF